MTRSRKTVHSDMTMISPSTTRLPDPDVLQLDDFYERPEAYPKWIGEVVRRVTSGLVECSITILPISSEARERRDGLTSVETFVAAHYRRLGCRVVRLDHMVTTLLERGNLPNETWLTARERLEDDLLAVMPMSAYRRFVAGQVRPEEMGSLTALSPREYSLCCYPPDFMLGLPGRSFMFVEVKSETDALHFSQANWFVNLMPKDWHYEIVATVSRRLDRPIRIAGAKRKEGHLWAREFARVEKEAEEFRRISLGHRELERETKANPSFGRPPSRAAQARWIKDHLSKP